MRLDRIGDADTCATSVRMGNCDSFEPLRESVLGQFSEGRECQECWDNGLSLIVWRSHLEEALEHFRNIRLG